MLVQRPVHEYGISPRNRMSKRVVLNEGDLANLPDGRVVTFLEVDITAMDDPCYGCALAHINCTELDPITGPCGSDRPDGKFGIFVEAEN